MHRGVFFFTLMSMTFVGSSGEECSSQTTSSSLTYLVDTTASMGGYMAQLKLVNRWLLDRVTAKFPCGVRQYTMVEYNDPDVGPVRVTQSKKEFGDFFTSLVTNGGGDCPEMTMRGLELALMNSPARSYILVFTDASAADYGNTTLVNNVRTLINTTKSQVMFLLNGNCGSTNGPDFAIYQEIASLSYGHVYQLTIPEINKVFDYLDYTLSMPANSTTRIFSGDFTSPNHNESFPITSNFSSFMITTDGKVFKVQVFGPNLVSVKQLVSEPWGMVYVVEKPSKGTWTINVIAGGMHSIRVKGFTAFNTTSSCSRCHVNATCEDYNGLLQCVCKVGFIGNGFNCTDIDECAYSWTNKCPSGTSCSNSIGSYTCQCGFNNKCHPLAMCVNKGGSYSCACPTGYVGDGFSCEVYNCSVADCEAGKECVKSSYTCVDPCSNYTTLSESWRSSLNYVSPAYARGGDYRCDNYLSGWYRFMGSGGIRMPETCISSYNCGTHAPIWLNDVHPTTSDGIVHRTACATWGGRCCFWSSTIQIKACPGGYHVYKLSRTPACHLAYCTDPSTANTTCEADEEWKLGDRGHGCYCKSKFAVSSLADMRPEITCGTNEMKASFHKCQAKALGFTLGKDNFKNNNCFQFQDDKFTNTFSVVSKLQAGNCGVQPSRNSTHITYTSKLFITSKSDGITISCTYPLDMQASINQASKPISSSVLINAGGTAQFTVSMALFNDINYKVPYTGSKVSLSTKDNLYIGSYIEGGDNNGYVVVMKNCYATPSSNPNDTVKYDLIKDSCPIKKNSTISVAQNGVSREGRVSVQMFKFVGDSYTSVYLHCAVGLCNTTSGRCVPSCSGASSAGVDVETRDVTIGPIVSSAISHGLISASSILPALLLLLFSMFL